MEKAKKEAWEKAKEEAAWKAKKEALEKAKEEEERQRQANKLYRAAVEEAMHQRQVKEEDDRKRQAMEEVKRKATKAKQAKRRATKEAEHKSWCRVVKKEAEARWGVHTNEEYKRIQAEKEWVRFTKVKIQEDRNLLQKLKARNFNK